jgi:hypothetical protein
MLASMSRHARIQGRFPAAGLPGLAAGIASVLALWLAGCAVPPAPASPGPAAPLAATAPAPAASPSPMPGADRDAHGCIGSAGYRWCGRERACVRPWELAQARGLAGGAESVEQWCASQRRGH